MKKMFRQIALTLSPVNVELVRRLAKKDVEGYDLAGDLLWLGSLTPLSTRTAFALAKDGRDVYEVSLDGNDHLLEDIESESAHYLDKSKSWPQIEAIWVIEGDI